MRPRSPRRRRRRDARGPISYPPTSRRLRRRDARGRTHRHNINTWRRVSFAKSDLAWLTRRDRWKAKLSQGRAVQQWALLPRPTLRNGDSVRSRGRAAQQRALLPRPTKCNVFVYVVVGCVIRQKVLTTKNRSLCKGKTCTFLPNCARKSPV